MLKTFNLGGVHPAENKLSANQSIEILAIPKTVSIPISQHLGVPAVSIVNKGDKVKVGTLIAKGEAFISANIHSSVSGTVLKIDEVIDSSGYRKTAVIIEVEGDEWEESIDKSTDLKTEISLSSKEIIEKVKESGIVGLGGATFPSYVKLSVPEGKKVECLIINGVECEPYLTSDHRLMLEKTEEMLIGIKILMKALGVDKAIIGIENNKPDAIKKVSEVAPKYGNIEVCSLKVQYPQGGEKQLIQAITKREVPSGGLPLNVGVVVHNVGTAYAVYEAIQKNKPLIDRVVTITGKALRKPSNYLVRIGTPINDLIEKSGGFPQNTCKVVNGGPMMGKAINDINAPVTKGTSGVILFPEEESKRALETNCIRCAKCTQVCAMGLEPYLLSSLTEFQKWDNAEKNNIMDCMECGSCSYICPSGRPLLDYIRLGKNKVGQLIRSRK